MSQRWAQLSAAALVAAVAAAFLAARPASAALLNPSLEEDRDANGVPDSWNALRGPVYDRSGLQAFSGIAAARVNLRNVYWQSFPAIPGTHYTVGGRFRSDVGQGFANFFMQWTLGGVSVIGAATPGSFVGSQYGQTYASLFAPFPATEGLLFPRSADDAYWVWEDDLEACGEDFENSGFESFTVLPPAPTDWRLQGAPVYDGSGTRSHSGFGALGLAEGDGASQNLAVSPIAKHYTLALWARSDSAASLATVELAQIDGDGAVRGVQTFSFHADPQYARREIRFKPLPQSVLVRVTLGAAGAGRVWFDDLAAFWIAATPDRFSPNGDGLQDASLISFFLPDDPDVDAGVVGVDGAPIRSLLHQQPFSRGVAQVAWDGTDDHNAPVPDGQAVFRVSARSTRLGDWVATRTLSLDRSRFYVALPPRFDDFFPIGVWELRPWNVGHPSRFGLLADLASHGYNAAIALNLPSSQRAAVLGSATEAGIKIFLHAQETEAEIGRVMGYRALDEEAAHSAAEALVAAYGSSPALLGYYLFDEPSLEEAQAVGQAQRIQAQADPRRSGFSALGRSGEEAQTARILGMPVLMFDWYPFDEQSAARPASLAAFVSIHRELVSVARSLAKPLWGFVQTFGADDAMRRPTPAELRAQSYILAALGARGLFHFLLASAGTFSGLLDKNFEPTFLYETAGRVNAEIADLSPILLDLTPANQAVEVVTGAVVAEPYRDSVGRLWLILAATETEQPVLARIRVPGVQAARIYDAREKTEIPFLASGSDTLFDLILSPGDGRLLRLD